MKNMSIRKKLLTAILSVTIITIAGLAGITYHIASETIMKQNEHYMAEMVQKIVDEMRFWFDERVRESTLLSQDKLLLEAFDGGDSDAVEQRLAGYHKQSPVYENIFLANPDGVILWASVNLKKVKGLDLSKYPVYAINVAKTRQRQIWVGDAAKSPATGKPVCLITAPILSGNEVIGILGMPLELNYFTEALITKRRFCETGYLAVMDQKGILLAHPEKERILETDLSKFAFAREMLAQKNGGISYEWYGAEKIAQFKTYPEKDWTIAATIEKEELFKAINRMEWIFLTLGLTAVALISFVTWLIIAKSLVKPLNQVVAFVGKVSAGDLTETLRNGRQDELGMLLKSMNHMVVNLRDVVSCVQMGADNVSNGSLELSTGSEEMSQGSSEQAASAEQVSASMEVMSANIRQNADNAFQTEKIALACARDAEEGGNVVLETVSAMRSIAEKISVIEEIARRTNMLALNAAVEAARAGERGKGFAVVVAEVRKLSERTQKSATQISKLSDSSVEVAEKAGDILNQIVPNIQKTAELVQEISASCNEQSAGTEQINQAVQQLDQVIQQNASGAEEMASTAEELSGQADQLRNAMAFFKISQEAIYSEGMQAIQEIPPSREEKQHIRFLQMHPGKNGGNGNGNHPAFIRGQKGNDMIYNMFREMPPGGNGNGKGKNGGHASFIQDCQDTYYEEFERY